MDPFRNSKSFDFSDTTFPDTGNSYEIVRTREIPNFPLVRDSTTITHFSPRDQHGFIPHSNTPGNFRPGPMNGAIHSFNSKASTLFIGDLSVLCNEESIYELFHPYGQIESIQLKKSERDPQRAHLGYGFIKFSHPDAATRALNELNGIFFLGRKLRVGWADGGNANARGGHHSGGARQNTDQKKLNQTAQIHVMFVTKDLSFRISEMNLRNTFGQFGNLVDIAIKKNVLNEEMHVQSGYGFIHYALTEEGIRSAVMAVERIDHQTVDRVSYQCKITHSLQAHIYSMKYQQKSSPISQPVMLSSSHPVNDSYHAPRNVFHRLQANPFPETREQGFPASHRFGEQLVSMDSYDQKYQTLVGSMEDLLLTNPLEPQYSSYVGKTESISFPNDPTTAVSAPLIPEQQESTIALSPPNTSVLPEDTKDPRFS